MTLRKLRDAVVLMIAFLAVLWALQVFNWADGYRLDNEFGILPEHLSHLPDIFTAPFLHFSWQHIEGNSIPLFVLGVLAAYRSLIKFLLVSLVVIVVSGLAVWLFQSSNELTVGASGLIFGYFGYVLIRGFVERHLIDIGVGIVAGVLYWTILQVAIPGTPGISWIGHLGGLAGGVLAAFLVRDPSRAVPGGRWTLGLDEGEGAHRDDGQQPGRPAPSAGSAGPTAPAGGRRVSKKAEDMLRELKKDMGL